MRIWRRRFWIATGCVWLIGNVPGEVVIAIGALCLAFEDVGIDDYS